MADIKKDIEDLLNKSTRLSSATRKNFQDQLDLLIQQGAQLERFEALYGSIGDSVDAVRDNLKYISDSLKDSVNELSNGRKYLQDQKSILNKLSDIARNTLNIRRGETEFDKTKVAKLKFETKQRIETLEVIKQQHAVGSQERNAIEDQIKQAYKILTSFQRIAKVDEGVNRTLGVTPKLLGGIDKALQKLGMPNLGFAEALSETKKEAQEAAGLGNKDFKVWGTLTGKVADNFKSMLSTSNMIQGIIALMIKGFFSLNEAQTKFQNETGLTVKHVDTLNMSLISSSDYIKQAIGLTKELGMNATLIFTPATLQEAAELTNLIGLSVDESDRLAILSKVSGKELTKTSENMVKIVGNFNKTNKSAISAKAVLQDVAKTSDSISMTFGGNPEKIAAAAAEARKLGLTLEGVNASADALLNFESSINDEISAELITGQQLNLEKARLYAINDDIAGLTKEIGNNEGIINGYLKGNRISREAIATSIGMSKDALAKMVYTQQIQKGLSSEAAAQAAGVELSDMKRLSVQDSINKSIEKMGEALAGPLEFLAKMASHFGVIQAIIGLLVGVQIVKMIVLFGQLAGVIKIIRGLEIGAAIAKGWSAAMSSPASLLTGGIAGLALGGIITAAIMSSAKSAGDMYSPADGKTQVSTKEGGLFELSKNDSLMAFPESKMSTGKKSSSKSSPTQQQDLSPLLDELKALRQETSKQNKKPITVQNSMNGSQFGTSLAMNSYKTQ